MLLAATPAFANGANDNFRGVATLFGYGTARYRTVLIWATLTALGGSLLALVLAAGLVDTFKGKGLLPDAVTADARFLFAVGLGADRVPRHPPGDAGLHHTRADRRLFGALFGIGTVTGTARAKAILLAWVTTLPTGAAGGNVVYLLACLTPS